MTRTLKRSTLLRYGTAVGIGAIVPSELARGARPELAGDWSTGTLLRLLSSTKALVRLAGSRARQRVVLAQDAEVVHAVAGHVADLRAFIPGEEVVFEVQADAGAQWTVRAFQSLYANEEFEVVSASDRSIETTIGTLSLPRWSNPLRNGAPQPGQVYRATTWTDPRSGERVAMTLDPV
jgi:hypothetical protein